MTVTDDAFDAMADNERRQLLSRLLHDGPQPVPQLSNASREMLEAHETLLREYLAGSNEIADADKEAIRTHHVHLPKLVEYSHIEWNKDRHVTTKGPKFEDLRPLLEAVDAEHGDHSVTRDSSAAGRAEWRTRSSGLNAVSDR